MPQLKERSGKCMNGRFKFDIQYTLKKLNIECETQGTSSLTSLGKGCLLRLVEVCRYRCNCSRAH